MEKVQFNLEATLPELRDLYDKGLFTKVCLPLWSAPALETNERRNR